MSLRRGGEAGEPAAAARAAEPRRARQPAVPEQSQAMQAQMMHVETVPGRVLVGPKKLRNGYARIVSLRDGSGRIEKFDSISGTWLPAPESITFSEVWSAPSVSALQWLDVDNRR